MSIKGKKKTDRPEGLEELEVYGNVFGGQHSPLGLTGSQDQLWNVCHFKVIRKTVLDVLFQHSFTHWLNKTWRLLPHVRCWAGCRDRSSFILSKKVKCLWHRTWVMAPYLSCKRPPPKTHVGWNFINVEEEVGCWVAKGSADGEIYHKYGHLVLEVDGGRETPGLKRWEDCGSKKNKMAHRREHFCPHQVNRKERDLVYPDCTL